MEQEIKQFIEKHYKTVKVEDLLLEHGHYLIIKMYQGRNKVPHIATRILNTYPQIDTVHFTGGWMEGVYTRETLRYCGYNIKNHKK